MTDKEFIESLWQDTFAYWPDNNHESYEQMKRVNKKIADYIRSKDKNFLKIDK